MTTNTTVGTCSLCGGQVTVPGVYHSVIPPTPTCSSCGAMAASHGPVIPMVRPQSTRDTSRPDPLERVCYQSQVGMMAE